MFGRKKKKAKEAKEELQETVQPVDAPQEDGPQETEYSVDDILKELQESKEDEPGQENPPAEEQFDTLSQEGLEAIREVENAPAQQEEPQKSTARQTEEELAMVLKKAREKSLEDLYKEKYGDAKVADPIPPRPTVKDAEKDELAGEGKEFVTGKFNAYDAYIREMDLKSQETGELPTRFLKYLAKQDKEHPNFEVDKEAVEKLYEDFHQEEMEHTMARKGIFKGLFKRAQMESEKQAEPQEPQEQPAPEETQPLLTEETSTRLQMEGLEDIPETGAEVPPSEEPERNQQPETDYIHIKDNFNNLSDSMGDLVSQIRGRTIGAAVATVLLLAVHFNLLVPDAINGAVNPMANLAVQLVLFAAVMAAGYKEILNGIRSIVTFRAEPDAILAFSSIVTLIHGITQVASAITTKNFYFFGGVVAVVMVVVLFTKMNRLSQIHKNVKLMKSQQCKLSMECIEDKRILSSLFNGDDDMSEFANVFYERNITETQDFEDIAFGVDETHDFSTYAVPLAIVYAIVVTAAYVFLKQDFTSIFTAFAAVSAVIAPFTMEMSYTVPYANLANRMRENGNVVAGSESIRQMYDCDGVVVEDNYLFEKGNIFLKSMKVFGDVRIDEIIVDVASVLTDMNCAVGKLFTGILQNKMDMLHKVQGWESTRGEGVRAQMADGNELIIGKKEFMIKNGCELPAVLDRKGTDISGKSNMLYVGSEGRVYCVFEVCYEAGPEVKDLMEVLHNNGVMVYFKSCDMFLDEKFMEENFQLSAQSFKMVGEDIYMDVEELMRGKQESYSGIYMSESNLENMADIVCECKRVRDIVKRNLMITIASIVLAPLAVVGLLAFQGLAGLTTMTMLGVLLVFIIPLLINSSK